MNLTQNKILHGLLTSMGQKENKVNLVFGFSGGRSESSKDLTDKEADDMINYLKTLDGTAPAANKMRRKIISMAHEMHWHLSGTQAIDMPRLNGWCEKFSYLHKKLNDYHYNELPKLVTQFTSLYKDFLNKL